MVRLSPAFASPDPSAPCARTLGDEIAELAAHIHVATHRLLLKLREFDAMTGWAGGGFRSTAEWLSWRTGISPGAAREKVRVARALKHLPRISEAMERGELSYSKARALTRVADLESERRLLDVALNATAAQVELLVAGWARLDRITLERAAANGAGARPTPCALHLAPDPATGMWRIHGHLEPEVALVLERALAMAAEAVFRGAPAGEVPLLPERKAEALGLLAEAALRSGVEVEGRRTTGRADRFQVMLHVSAETSTDAPAHDACAACDASRVKVTHAPDGSILDVGRRTRIVPPALRRALEVRDGGCTHPLCTNRICDAHHVVPWQDGGATSLENLVLLCRRHHRAVHRGELSVRVQVGAGAWNLVFRDAEGRELTAVPPLPALCEDPVAALRRDHAARGLDPVTLAALPKWDGTPLDLGLALDWLWRPRAVATPGGSLACPP
jgi:hypothetical protein